MASSPASPSFPYHITTHQIPSQHVREYARATANSQEDVLYLSIKQYTPKDNPEPQAGDVTILGTHANGFPKELYEALWADLHAAAPTRGFRIRAIWVADITNQGASGVANERALGNDPSWNDHPRDLLHMVNVFRRQMPRPLLAVGHSFGANMLTHLALLHPRLLTTLVLLDPTITEFGFQRDGPGITVSRGSAFRRELWPSRDAAAAAFRRSKAYNTWDPRVLNSWIAHGVRPLPTALFPGDGNGNDDDKAGAVTLTTAKHQELFSFFRPLWPFVRPDGSVDRDRAPDFDPDAHDSFDNDVPFPFYRHEGAHVLRRLPEVRPSVLYIFGGTSDLSTPERRRVKLDTTGVGPNGSGGAAHGRVKGIVMDGLGHLFPMQVPTDTARHAADWIGSELRRWRAEQAEYDAWTKLSFRDKTTMSAEFLARVGRPPPPQHAGKNVPAGSKL